ncbi:hypothetical protein ACFSTD_04050 [Novosphingobium colocasiae]
MVMTAARPKVAEAGAQDPKSTPSEAWIARLQARFPTERTVDEALTRKLRNRADPPYRPSTLAEVAGQLRAFFAVHAPRSRSARRGSARRRRIEGAVPLYPARTGQRPDGLRAAARTARIGGGNPPAARVRSNERGARDDPGASCPLGGR